MMTNRSDSPLRFQLRKEHFCIHRLPPDHPVDIERLRTAPWYSITRTEDELSVVAPEGIDPGPAEREPGWSCLQIAGTLDFSLIGIIADVARVLADAGVALFVVSTYNTDYILVKSVDIKTAVRALSDAGHEILKD